ncbi:MAG: MASE1 domain-containing protein [Methylotenera sp.]|nr:MASE1 domain-containing protein [Methylotenera sp.]
MHIQFIKYSRKDLVTMLAGIVLHAFLIKVTFNLYTQGEAAIIWLPSGVGLAMLILYGKRFWPAVFFGFLIGYGLVLNWPILSSAMVAMFSNTLESVFGLWLLSITQPHGRKFDVKLSEPMDFLQLGMAALISAGVATLMGCTILNILEIYSWSNFNQDLLHWWMGNFFGMILVIPLVLTWRKAPTWCVAGFYCKAEILLYLVLALLLGQMLFVGGIPHVFNNMTQSYLMFVIISWGAIRFGYHGVSLVIIMTSIQALIGTATGVGIFSNDVAESNYINLWQYIFTLTIVGILLSTMVQKRRQSEVALVDNEKNWECVFEASGDGLWDWNLQTNEVNFSENWKSMLGYEAHEVSHHFNEWESRVHPDDKQEVIDAIASYRAGKSKTYINEHRLLCKDGSWKWILSRAMLTRSGLDKNVQHIIGTHTDITKHKALEESLKKSEDELYAIFSQSPDGIIVINPDHQVSAVNKAFCHMTDQHSNNLIGVKESTFDSIMQSLCGEKGNYPATSNFQSLANQSFQIQQDVPRRRTTDKSEYIEILMPKHRVLMRSVLELDQHRLSRVMYFRDITTEMMIDRMKSEYLSTAAHELRTPLSIILGYTELLKLKSFDSDIKAKMVDAIHDQSQSMVLLINELLDLARIESQTGNVFNMQKYSLVPLLEGFVANFTMTGDPRKVKLIPLPRLPELIFDKEKLSQALKNCFSNAFKFSKHDSEVTLQATLVQYQGRSNVAITVTDHGIGMTSKQLNHIYDKFYRADTSGNIPGTGLGMAITKEIIEHHGGNVRIESEADKGTSVTLLLPVQ